MLDNHSHAASDVTAAPQLLEAVLERVACPVDLAVPRPEYPRPQFVRDRNWMNLNGQWEFEIDFGRSGRARGLHGQPHLSGKITVPFCPESRLSGIAHTDFMAAVWYKRTVALPDRWSEGRVLLHVGACDYHTWVYIDGVEVGTHVGGYTPFSFDITDCLKDGRSEVTITIYAEDEVRTAGQAKGKQSQEFASHGCDYTRTTGIWQTVWLEAVPKTYLAATRITPQLGAAGALVETRLAGDIPDGASLRLRAHAGGKLVGETVTIVSGKLACAFLAVSEEHAWSPGQPFLYDLTLTLENDEGAIDTVSSYFGLRSVEIDGPAVLINGKTVFQRLILDQGFYPEGIYTAPTDSDLKRDIEMSLAMGYNGARMHQKIFDPRFLYWCDRLGYLTWGESPDWGLDVAQAESFAGFLQTWVEATERDYNHPSIVGWCPFNEHDAARTPEAFRSIYRITKALDPTRPVIDSSGWSHVETDVFDVHDYDQDPVTFEARYQALLSPDGKVFQNDPLPAPGGEFRAGQPYMVSEFGGIWWNPEKAAGWGYGRAPTSPEEFLTRYRALTEALLSNPKIFGFCYTQLTDVEQEVNGLYTYDRKPKFDPAILRAINAQAAAIEK